jgi:hypothetical protein
MFDIGSKGAMRDYLSIHRRYELPDRVPFGLKPGSKE